MTLLYVALGAAVGAPIRYVAGHYLDGGHTGGPAGRPSGERDGGRPGRLPWGTILVNVAGSFLLGLCSGLALAGAALALLGTGFCGALTTYSAFAVQTHDRGWRRGTANVALTVVPALLLCAAGFWLGARG